MGHSPSIRGMPFLVFIAGSPLAQLPVKPMLVVAICMGNLFVAVLGEGSMKRFLISRCVSTFRRGRF